jgi:hypothetical protein
MLLPAPGGLTHMRLLLVSGVAVALLLAGCARPAAVSPAAAPASASSTPTPTAASAPPSTAESPAPAAPPANATRATNATTIQTRLSFDGATGAIVCPPSAPCQGQSSDARWHALDFAGRAVRIQGNVTVTSKYAVADPADALGIGFYLTMAAKDGGTAPVEGTNGYASVGRPAPFDWDLSNVTGKLGFTGTRWMQAALVGVETPADYHVDLVVWSRE